MSLLRKELVKVVAENRNLQRKIFEIEAMLTKKNTPLELEVDCLRLELAKRDKRMEKYENSDPIPPRVRCTMQNAPLSESRWRMRTSKRTDLNWMTKTRPAGGRRMDGESRCIVGRRQDW